MLSYIGAVFILTPHITYAAGNTLYVSPNGGGSCSSSSPCSLDTGLNQLRGGDTLILQGGNYSQMLSVPGGKGGSSDGNRTVIRVADGATVTLRGLEVWQRFAGKWATSRSLSSIKPGT